MSSRDAPPRYYVRAPGEGALGPLSEEELKRGIQRGAIRRGSLVRVSGEREWLSLDQVLGGRPANAPAPRQSPEKGPRARELDVTCTLGRDQSGGATVAFEDAQGRTVDGSGGVDALMLRVAHHGEWVRLPERMRRVLGLVAELGGHWRPEVGAFAVRPDALPEIVLASRALPEREAPTETPEIRALSFDTAPARLVEEVDLADDGRAMRGARVEDAAGSELPYDDVLRQAATASWVRVGNRYMGRPDLAPSEISHFRKQRYTEIAPGSVPLFFARELKRLGARVPVRLTPRAEAVRLLNQPSRVDAEVGLLDDSSEEPPGSSAGATRSRAAEAPVVSPPPVTSSPPAQAFPPRPTVDSPPSSPRPASSSPSDQASTPRHVPCPDSVWPPARRHVQHVESEPLSPSAPRPLPSDLGSETRTREMSALREQLTALTHAEPAALVVADVRRQEIERLTDRGAGRVKLAAMPIGGVGEALIEALAAAGYRTLRDLSLGEGWKQIPGMGEASEARLREALAAWRQLELDELSALPDDALDRLSGGRISAARDAADLARVEYERRKHALELRLEELGRRPR